MENKNTTVLSQYAQSNLSKIGFSLLGIILLSVSSKISIPFYPVPMTLQTFVVYFIAASMGMVGFYATVSYVILGLIGLPIFAAGGGFGYVMSPTFGFLYGMILASFVIAYFSKNLLMKYPDEFLTSIQNSLKRKKLTYFFKHPLLCINYFYLRFRQIVGEYINTK